MTVWFSLLTLNLRVYKNLLPAKPSVASYPILYLAPLRKEYNAGLSPPVKSIAISKCPPLNFFTKEISYPTLLKRDCLNIDLSSANISLIRGFPSIAASVPNSQQLLCRHWGRYL